MYIAGITHAIVSNLGSAFTGLAATTILGILLFPIRTFFKNVSKEWQSATEKLSGLEKELTLQRTNCLTTLQGQGQSQIDLLEHANETLQKMHDSQLEMSGYLKASHDRN